MNDVIENLIKQEEELIAKKINLIASENIPSDRVFKTMGSILSQRYSEGYPGKRYYGGNEIIDLVENYSISLARELFHCNFANVQPHSGSQANAAAIMAFVRPGGTILGMDLNAGGHLTHGSKPSFSGKFYNAVHYGVDENGFLNYNELEEQLYAHQPQLLIVGCSAYSRAIDYKRIRNIVDKYNNLMKDKKDESGDSLEIDHCYIMVDMAHIAGLVATGLHESPLEYADVVTTTTHKTLRGPRGGLILWNNEEYTKKINSAVFPGTQGGPNNALTAAKAVCFEEALQPEFKQYMTNVVENMKSMVQAFIDEDIKVMTNGTDNHQCLISVKELNITGKEAQELLEQYDIITNKNRLPGDDKIDTGIRIGTALITTQGWSSSECYSLGIYISKILKNDTEDKLFTNLRLSFEK